ncbi:MAG: DnaB-like helicase N-terminal domain-containing protein, partial [Floccifex sp.]
MARELPNSQPMEQSLLGSILIYPSVMADCQDMDLNEEEFYLPSHQKIYQSMFEIYESNKIVDLNTLITRLADKNELDAAGGADYIIRLADSAISAANTKNYIETIKNKAQLRQLIYTADRISQNCYESSDEIDILLDDAERSIMDVTRHRRGEEFGSSQLIVSRVIEE